MNGRIGIRTRDFEKVVGNSAADSDKRFEWAEGFELIAVRRIDVYKVIITNTEATTRGGHNEASLSSVCCCWIGAAKKIAGKGIIVS
jgi:hypothetical protein